MAHIPVYKFSKIPAISGGQIPNSTWEVVNGLSETQAKHALWYVSIVARTSHGDELMQTMESIMPVKTSKSLIEGRLIALQVILDDPIKLAIAEGESLPIIAEGN